MPAKSCSGGSETSASEELTHIPIPDIDDNFISTHFFPLTSLSETLTKIMKDGFVQQWLSDLNQGSKESELYEPLGNIFNNIATLVCDVEPMLFHPSFNTGTSGGSYREDRLSAPDFGILPRKHISTFMHTDKSRKLRVPWSALESFVEVKTKKHWNHRQAIDYIETLLQYRPDKVYALGMSCNQQFYQFYYADACIQKSSPVFHWKDSLEECVQFIHSLHHIYKEDIGRDKSFTLHDVRWQRGLNVSAKWRVVFDGKTNEVQRMLARKGTGGRTWVGIGQEIDSLSTTTNNFDRIRIIKDRWGELRRSMESEILNQIHKDGYIAGVVRHISAGPVNELIVADSKGDRIKERVVMASTGLHLSACESVLDFLKVMYDLVETHEQLLEKRGVLHRDISWYNVLCQPEHFVGNDKVIEHATIGQILGKEGKEREPLCLLMDFDNARLTKENNPRAAVKRTGTPMFIACELSYGSSADRIMRRTNVDLAPNQFSLNGDVLEAYLEVYGKERYNDYESWLQSIVSGTGKVSNPVVATGSIVSHQPIHDMESIYWIILWFIVKAWPMGVDLGSGKPEPDGHSIVKDLILHRRIGVTAQAVLIVPFLQHDEENWRDMLNPVYEPLFGMLVNMGQYICMRWSDFPVVPTWHAHEAFKRLLLKEIVRMTNENDPIPINGPRPSRRPVPERAWASSSRNPTQTGSSSHRVNPADPQSVGGRKRQNSTPGDSASLKKPRTEAAKDSDDPNLLARIMDNFANDTWWFS